MDEGTSASVIQSDTEIVCSCRTDAASDLKKMVMPVSSIFLDDNLI